MLLTAARRSCMFVPFEQVGVLVSTSAFVLSATLGLGGGRLGSSVVLDLSPLRRDRSLVA